MQRHPAAAASSDAAPSHGNEAARKPTRPLRAWVVGHPAIVSSASHSRDRAEFAPGPPDLGRARDGDIESARRLAGALETELERLRRPLLELVEG